MAQLRSVTCRMGSHSVTCHPTQANTPRLNPSQTGRYSIYLPRRDMEGWVDLYVTRNKVSDVAMAAICHKSWGSRPEATSFSPSVNPPFLWICAEPAHPLPNILMQFMQSYSLIRSTLMFNILPGTEISVYAEFSHCRHNWRYGLQAMYSSMALKSWGPCTFGRPHWQKVRTRK